MRHLSLVHLACHLGSLSPVFLWNPLRLGLFTIFGSKSDLKDLIASIFPRESMVEPGAAWSVVEQGGGSAHTSALIVEVCDSVSGSCPPSALIERMGMDSPPGLPALICGVGLNEGLLV